MEYLVRSIKKGYYISKKSIETIKSDEDSIDVVLSWEDGKRKESFSNYFSSIKRNIEEIEIQRKKNFDKTEFINFMKYCYVKDRCLLEDLFKKSIIEEEELEELEKLNEEAENKQIVLINNCYNTRRTLKIGFFHR